MTPSRASINIGCATAKLDVMISRSSDQGMSGLRIYRRLKASVYAARKSPRGSAPDTGRLQEDADMMHFREFTASATMPDLEAAGEKTGEPARGPRGLLIGLIGGAALWAGVIAAVLLLR